VHYYPFEYLQCLMRLNKNEKKMSIIKCKMAHMVYGVSAHTCIDCYVTWKIGRGINTKDASLSASLLPGTSLRTEIHCLTTAIVCISLSMLRTIICIRPFSLMMTILSSADEESMKSTHCCIFTGY
jgi:hypothetical protein